MGAKKKQNKNAAQDDSWLKDAYDRHLDKYGEKVRESDYPPRGSSHEAGLQTPVFASKEERSKALRDYRQTYGQTASTFESDSSTMYIEGRPVAVRPSMLIL